MLLVLFVIILLKSHFIKIPDALTDLILDLNLGINHELVDFELGKVVIEWKASNSKVWSRFTSCQDVQLYL